MREARMEKVKNWLSEKNIDAAFIHSTENVFYLTGFYTDPHERLMGLFVFKEGEPFFICPGMETGQAREAGWNGELIGYGDHEDPFQYIKNAADKRIGGKAAKLAAESELLSYSRAEQLIKTVQSEGLHPIEELLNEIRLVKDEKEIEILEKAAELADFGVQAGVNALKEGVTEMDVLAEIEYQLKRKGVSQMSFSTMVLFGKKSGQPHGNPGLDTLKKGDLVLFDLGVVLDGYCSDITRTVAFQSADEKQKEIYQTCLEANLAALEASKPGTRIGDLDLAARKVIEDAGYGENFPHRLGHGLGISVHEYPSMAYTNNGVLKEGMVYTVEPGIYVPEIGGVRIEDDVLVTKDGCRTLTKFPKELQIIE
ncbi:Xaa-Pro peptidase family protein [Metabacillus sp. GX 13764]|uniref:M24 family metallopeptidase n=1 Tax=Metabacillus kandeliae TaxID=2900151 RepID=UPI001E509732|nr:Xaa-Pro peptidase family protein [Metabacillus kandeliae]MCD7036118.1 Xaa-Pro peptidase family protein [Metabacillus kandeliae]